MHIASAVRMRYRNIPSHVRTCRLIRIHRTVCRMTKLLEYFTCREWHWTTDNVRQLLNDMSASDRLVTVCLSASTSACLFLCKSLCLNTLTAFNHFWHWMAYFVLMCWYETTQSLTSCLCLFNCCEWHRDTFDTLTHEAGHLGAGRFGDKPWHCSTVSVFQVLWHLRSAARTWPD